MLSSYIYRETRFTFDYSRNPLPLTSIIVGLGLTPKPSLSFLLVSASVQFQWGIKLGTRSLRR